MDREQFDKLEIINQLEYVNDLLSKGQTLRKISSDIPMSKTTFRDRFISLGYIYKNETKRYCKDDTIKLQKYYSNTKVPKNEDKRVTKVINSNQELAIDINDEKLLEVGTLDEELVELIAHKNDLLELLKTYKKETIRLDINDLPPKMQVNIVNKSIKVSAVASDLFDKVCNSYPSLKKQDMISLAMWEFCSKYKK